MAVTIPHSRDSRQGQERSKSQDFKRPTTRRYPVERGDERIRQGASVLAGGEVRPPTLSARVSKRFSSRSLKADSDRFSPPALQAGRPALPATFLRWRATTAQRPSGPKSRSSVHAAAPSVHVHGSSVHISRPPGKRDGRLVQLDEGREIVDGPPVHVPRAPVVCDERSVPRAESFIHVDRRCLSMDGSSGDGDRRSGNGDGRPGSRDRRLGRFHRRLGSGDGAPRRMAEGAAARMDGAGERTDNPAPVPVDRDRRSDSRSLDLRVGSAAPRSSQGWRQRGGERLGSI